MNSLAAEMGEKKPFFAEIAEINKAKKNVATMANTEISVISYALCIVGIGSYFEKHPP